MWKGPAGVGGGINIVVTQPPGHELRDFHAALKTEIIFSR